MNGPNHYRKAEQLLQSAQRVLDADDPLTAAAAMQAAPLIVAAAQVHATLALAAATVADLGIGPMESSGWHSLHADDAWREAVR